MPGVGAQERLRPRIGWLAALAASIFVAGCTQESVPSDKLAAEVVRPYAESGVAGVEIADYRRNNGWQDTETPGRYIVQYAYNYELKQPLVDVVLALAKDEFETQVQENWQVEFAAKQWANEQEDFAARRDRFLTGCKACFEYWEKAPSEKEGDARWRAFLLAWSTVESLGFRDDAVVGAKVPRTAWASFHKTENGWAPVRR